MLGSSLEMPGHESMPGPAPAKTLALGTQATRARHLNARCST